MKSWIALAVTAGLVSAACSSVDDKTQVTIALESETEIPKELDSFVVRVFSTRTGELRFSQDYFPTSGREFPTTLAVIPRDEDSLESPLRIELEGRKGGSVFLRRSSVVSYFKDRNILLRMPLRMACFQFKDCGPTATCSGGQCVTNQPGAAELVDYDPKYVFADASTCFDEERCLGTEVEVKVEDDCSFALPPGAPESAGNVAIRWAAAPERILALEYDNPQEGWTRTAPDRGKLSQGACDSHLERRGIDGALLVPDHADRVYFSPRCAAKTRAVPYCFSPSTGHAGVGANRP